MPFTMSIFTRMLRPPWFTRLPARILLNERKPDKATGLIVSCRQMMLLLEKMSVKSVMVVLGVLVFPSRMDSMFQDVTIREDIWELKTPSWRPLRALTFYSNIEYRCQRILDGVSEHCYTSGVNMNSCWVI